MWFHFAWGGARHRIGLLLAALVFILAVLLWLSPAERTLGQTVKLVYLHGALVRTAMVMFAASWPLNVVVMLTSRRELAIWGKALVWTALVMWILHALFSMVTTYAAWGVFIAWFEPRTRFTFILALVGTVIVVVTGLLDSTRFSALVFALLSGLTLALAPRLGVIQHPLNPIGSSPSYSIRIFYTAIQAVSVAIGGLLTVWLRSFISTDRQ